jgi:hypothetical protein
MSKTNDQARTPFDLMDKGISVEVMAAELGLLAYGCRAEDSILKASLQGAIVALNKLSALAPLMEHLFQSFAGGWHGPELHDAITEVWKEWAKA